MHRFSATMSTVLVATTLLAATDPAGYAQQRERPDNETFLHQSPRVGELIPDVIGYDEQGEPFPLRARLRGSYTVLVFGCLT